MTHTMMPKRTIGPASSLKTHPLLYLYFDDFDELEGAARRGHLQIAIHDADPRSRDFCIEDVLADEELLLRLYSLDLLRVRFPDGTELFRSAERAYWEMALHPEQDAEKLSEIRDPDLRMAYAENLQAIEPTLQAMRLRYGLSEGSEPATATSTPTRAGCAIIALLGLAVAPAVLLALPFVL